MTITTNRAEKKGRTSKKIWYVILYRYIYFIRILLLYNNDNDDDDNDS